MPTLSKVEGGYNETIKETTFRHNDCIIEMELRYSGQYEPKQYFIEATIFRENGDYLESLSTTENVDRMIFDLLPNSKPVEERIDISWEKIKEKSKQYVNNYIQEKEKADNIVKEIKLMSE